MNGHQGNHITTQPYGPPISVNSVHHQAMIDFSGCQVLGKAEDGILEITAYDMNHLGYQSHPEWMSFGSPSREIFFRLVEDYCFGGK